MLHYTTITMLEFKQDYPDIPLILEDEGDMGDMDDIIDACIIEDSGVTDPDITEKYGDYLIICVN